MVFKSNHNHAIDLAIKDKVASAREIRAALYRQPAYSALFLKATAASFYFKRYYGMLRAEGDHVNSVQMSILRI